MSNYKQSNSKDYKNKGKGKRPFPHKGSKFQQDEVVSDTTYKGIHTNNPSWLDHNPELTRAVSSLNFASRIGVAYDLEPAGNITNATVLSPSLMVLNYVPAVGISTSYSDPINLAANMLSSYMRTKISGQRSYDPQDIMLYIMSVASVYDMINIGRRAYGVARYYNTWNVSTPTQYLTALGFSASDIIGKMADFNAKLNQLTLAISTVHIPRTLEYVNRHAALTGSIFCDSELSARSQMYAFTPSICYKYDETSGAGKLVATAVPGAARFTVSSYYNLVKGMIDAIIASQDCWTIDGDIIKTFNDFYTLSELPLDATAIPVYDKGMQTQFENLTAVGKLDITTLNITQDVDQGCLVFNPKTAATTIGTLWQDRVLNFHWMDPTPLDIMYATQFTVVPNKRSNEGVYPNITHVWEFNSVGTEIVETMTLWNARSTTAGVELTSDITGWPGSGMGVLVHAQETQNALGILSFDWHPTIYWEMKYEDGERVDWLGCGQMVDLDNFTVITKETLRQIHDVALLSYFGVPMKMDIR